jgi:hypothetical protein
MSLSLSPRGSLAAVLLALGVFAASLLGVVGPVSQAAAVGSCTNEAFRTGPSAALPDCRAYEMVSPPDKNGGEVDGGIHNGPMAPPEQAAENGEAITYGSSSSFIETEAASVPASSQYLSTRTAGGWRTREITPTQELPEGRLETIGEGVPDFSLFQGFSEDLTSGFLLAWNPQPDPLAPAGYYNPYLRNDGSGGYQLLSDVTPPTQPTGQVDSEREGFGVAYAGMSADGQHVIFEANDALTPEAVPGQVNLYEWNAGQPLELVSVLPEGKGVDSSGRKYPLAIQGSEEAMKFGSSNVGGLLPYNYSGALSSDGRRAFWSGGVAGGEQVYMHEITESGSRTVDVSASQKSGEASGAADYWTANAEGSLVYFTSSSQLTDDSTAGAGKPDLYQYDVLTGVLSDLSVAPNAGEAADVQGVLGMGESEGIPDVYFVARGRLVQGAKAGEENLYVSRGSSGVQFIATLGESEGETLEFTEAIMERTSRVSPDGKLLAFQSSEPLTGYDNLPANGENCPGPATAGSDHPYANTVGGRCMEVYEYDAQTGALACASCDPSGLPPTADSVVPEVSHLFENLRGWQSSTVQQRYLLDDGRLYFQSEDALLAQATNGRQNIYEYEPEGVGQCAASGEGSCLYLISTGESSGNSYFADASTDGRDVFFLTNEQLVPQDGDGAVDVYDAREGGGFSSATPPPCSGEACKPAVTPAPAIYGAPSSATFQGAGDIPALPVVQPKVVKKASKKRKSKGKRKSKNKRKVHTGRKSARRSERGRR